MGGAAAFGYERALAPLLWTFAVLIGLELALVHLLLAALGHALAAWILSALSLASLVWVVLLIRSLGRRPVLVDSDGVTMRLGTLKSVQVPADRIVALRMSWPSDALNDRGVLNLAMINYPNVMIEIDPPLSGRRPVRAIAHRLDDPASFAAAVQAIPGARA